jgi:ergothioneine biosynthesis protein EgtB
MADNSIVISRGLDMNEVAERFVRVRERTDRLTGPLSPEDQMAQSMDDVSPTKWHRAHTTWFFAEFVLGADGTSNNAWDRPEYRFLYNSYYDAVGARHPRPSRGLVTRPSMDEITDYRMSVDDAIGELLAVDRLTVEQLGAIELGTHHEEQHQELMLIDIKHVLSMNPAVGPAYATRDLVDSANPGAMSFVGFEGGIVEIGVDDEGVSGSSGFSFDHERPRHEVRLYDFSLANRLVTAGEWIEFINDGGYQRPEFWKSDGWYRAQSDGWLAPLYWRRNPDVLDEWWMHTLTGPRAVDRHDPVCHVSHYEADAFASWSGGRLPTEFEWEHAATLDVADSGDRELTGRFLDEENPDFSFHPTGAAPGVDGSQLRQLFGDAWEWTSSAYEPYHGFATAEGAIGEYNGKFMSGQQVLRGGGSLTPPGHTRVTYRNFFHPHTRWHLGGVRLAKDED